jgi:hypothetical protein
MADRPVSRTGRRNLNPQQLAAIAELYEQGTPPKEIALETGILLSTVHENLQRRIHIAVQCKDCDEFWTQYESLLRPVYRVCAGCAARAWVKEQGQTRGVAWTQ